MRTTPPLQYFVDELTNEATSNARWVLSPGMPANGRLCEAHALAKQLDVILYPTFTTPELKIGLTELGSLENVLDKIKQADLVVTNVINMPLNRAVTRHEITLDGFDCTITAHTIHKIDPDETTDAPPPASPIVIDLDRGVGWLKIAAVLALFVAVYAWAGERDLADQLPRAEVRK